MLFFELMRHPIRSICVRVFLTCSQPHKHVQIVPLPLDPNESDEVYPLRKLLLEQAKEDPELVKGLPFVVAACRVSRERG